MMPINRIGSLNECIANCATQPDECRLGCESQFKCSNLKKSDQPAADATPATTQTTGKSLTPNNGGVPQTLEERRRAILLDDSSASMAGPISGALLLGLGAVAFL